MKQDILEKRPQRTSLDKVVPLDTPFTVFLDPSGACNFSCGFCPCNTTDFRNADRHKIMSLDLFNKIIADMKQFKSKIKVINLYCFGEPLLNKNIIYMIKTIKDSNVCNELRMITNGSLLNPKSNEQLATSGIDLIRISVEALNSEDYYKVSKAKVDFDSLVNNISDLHNTVQMHGGG